MINLLNRTAAEKTVMQMIYISNDGKVTQRFVRVLKVGERNFLAYCYYRKRVRTFKTENILSLQKTNKKISA